MPQADFAYAPANDLAGLPLAASIFADSAQVRDDLREDIEAAGLAVHDCAPLATLVEGEPRALGQVVLVDCPLFDVAAMAALARLDMRAARAGAHLVVATSVAALDDVFACCDQSAAQILVDPTRAERVVALGRAVMRPPGSRLRELSHDDRLTLLRLTEQVDEIAERLGRLGGTGFGLSGAAEAFHVESPRREFAGATAREGQLALPPRPPLPDPRLVRRIIRHRQLRARFFDPALFADPAWDILLDLAAARAEHKSVSVTSLCIASGVPPTTALRWIGQLTATGLLERVEDETDRRRTFITLSDTTADAVARYFAELGQSGTQLI
jgi:DNA-binding MarR family transcriptional regulator